MPTLPSSVSLDLVIGPTIASGEHISNYTAIQTAINSIISALNVGAGATPFLNGNGSTLTWVATPSIPVGVIEMYAGVAAPTGYLLCDGSAVNRTTYASLFTAISTTYGVGDGSTTFNVPDLRGRMPVGFAAAGGHADVSALAGADAVTLANRRPKHKHTVTDPGHTHSVGISNSGDSVYEGATLKASRVEANAGGTSGSGTTGISVGTSTDQADAPAYLVVNFIIKAT